MLSYHALFQAFRDLQAFADAGGWAAVQLPDKPLTEAAFRKWLAGAEPGDAVQYHAGLLTRDRDPKLSPLRSADRQRLDALATRVWHAAERGLVHPFSQRNDDGEFHYLAIRSSRSVNAADFSPALNPRAPISPIPTHKEFDHEPA